MPIFLQNQSTLIHIQKIIKKYNLNFKFKILKAETDLYLYLNSKGFLSLYSNRLEFNVDFSNKDITLRIDKTRKKPSIIQALEGKSRSYLNILDTTVGFATDSFTIASRGHKITAIENNKYVFLLLLDGLQRAKKDTELKVYANNITLHYGNSLEYLQTHPVLDFDAIYIDPMFLREKTKSKVKKNMQILQNIVDNMLLENEFLFSSALNTNVKKIVVKRAKNSAFLDNKKPSYQLVGKRNRFDAYIR